MEREQQLLCIIKWFFFTSFFLRLLRNVLWWHGITLSAEQNAEQSEGSIHQVLTVQSQMENPLCYMAAFRSKTLGSCVAECAVLLLLSGEK